MKWTPEAKDAIKNVPFLVRKKVRSRVEQEARQAGLAAVDLATVTFAQQRFLSGQASEIRGFQLDVCFGPRGCPNRTLPVDDLQRRIAALLEQADLLRFLKRHVGGPLKFHHEFRFSLAECPNACSQPQIKDIGVIAACLRFYRQNSRNGRRFAELLDDAAFEDMAARFAANAPSPEP